MRKAITSRTCVVTLLAVTRNTTSLKRELSTSTAKIATIADLVVQRPLTLSAGMNRHASIAPRLELNTSPRQPWV
ncbi:hypothetical protein IWX91DRAFT_328552, partial [Phyllosticta citricarpa]